MEWDGKIYKSIGYTIQASDTDEIVEEAFEYIAKESFHFLINLYTTLLFWATSSKYYWCWWRMLKTKCVDDKF